MLSFRSAGALGSRLTGAGWGGCAVSIVPATSLKSFLEVIESKFYDVSCPKLSGKKLEDVVFATKPGRGAAIYSL